MRIIDLLFLGNSYTAIRGLDGQVADLYAAAGDPVLAERLAEPGWRWVDHADALASPGSPHEEAFSGALSHVILQEQSQISGFPQGSAEWLASADALRLLDAAAAEAGATTWLLATWGRRDGDAQNPDRYPDFLTMNALVDAGYLAYAEVAAEDGAPAYVAPAGRAFAAAYQSVLDAGDDPLAAGSPFTRLYEDDGEHPSVRGSWLAACVVYAAQTGRSPVGLPAPPSIDDPDTLAQLAWDTVSTSELGYPWRSAPPAVDPEPAETGCDHAPAGVGPSAALLLLAARRRQRA